MSFGLGGKFHTDRKAPFTATFTVGRKPVSVIASGVVSISGKRAVLPGGLTLRCP